jgi:glutamate/tyrosine decarboxylase-like PLP-dependent enzyme
MSDADAPILPDIRVVPGVTTEELVDGPDDEDEKYPSVSPTITAVRQGLRALSNWQTRWPPLDQDENLRVPPELLRQTIDELTERLTDNYPFFHPAYAGQMLKPPHPTATIAYFLAQQINPNNHALDGGPATAAMEREVVAQLAAMFGYDPAATLGHLTSSGTIANLEALWVARSLHPDRAIAFSAEAHYTHRRMCEVIGARSVEIAADPSGRLDLADLAAKLATEQIGTVVATAGTTALGAVDPIDQVLPLATAHAARVHVDAAYGGFFALLKDEQAGGDPCSSALRLSPPASAAFAAIARCDSVVVDPHKHGLQPYGCGSVIFRDPTVGRFYRHDSPYTYFTSDELHLGEISLECSRAGAAAAALWATLRCFPLESDRGLGPVLQRTRAAAQTWADLIRGSDRLRLVVEPELDILAFYPLPADGDRRVSRVSALTQRVFATGMADRSFYLAKLVAEPALLAGHDLVWDEPTVTVLRSVLMKPEHLAAVPRLHESVLAVLAKASDATPP